MNALARARVSILAGRHAERAGAVLVEAAARAVSGLEDRAGHAAAALKRRAYALRARGIHVGTGREASPLLEQAMKVKLAEFRRAGECGEIRHIGRALDAAASLGNQRCLSVLQRCCIRSTSLAGSQPRCLCGRDIVIEKYVLRLGAACAAGGAAINAGR